MKNTIVVTGGAGFVGSNLISLLLKKTKFKIISIDNYSTGKKINHIQNKRVKYIKSSTKHISKILYNLRKNIKDKSKGFLLWEYCFSPLLPYLAINSFELGLYLSICKFLSDCIS